jgi:hypothetical protein
MFVRPDVKQKLFITIKRKIMEQLQALHQQITEQQQKYQMALMYGREFSNLKSIKNNIKKMQRQLLQLEKKVQ